MRPRLLCLKVDGELPSEGDQEFLPLKESNAASRPALDDNFLALAHKVTPVVSTKDLMGIATVLAENGSHSDTGRGLKCGCQWSLFSDR